MSSESLQVAQRICVRMEPHAGEPPIELLDLVAPLFAVAADKKTLQNVYASASKDYAVLIPGSL